jgi:competence protein ComEC
MLPFYIRAMKKIWNQAPLVRLILPFLGGIITAVHFPFQHFILAGLLALLIAAHTAIVLVQRFQPGYKNAWRSGFIIHSTLFLLGYQLSIFRAGKFDASHFSRVAGGKDQFVLARLSDPVIEKERSVKSVMLITAVWKKDHWQKTSGKAMVYLEKSAASLVLQYGDEVLLKADFRKVAPPGNPEEFNYQSFLAHHHIFQQAYVKDKDWKSRVHNSGNMFLKGSYALRNKLLNCLEENGLTGDELSVGGALMLGYTDKLDAEILSAYSETGALHVLSVSGLHAAIVYIVFSWLLFFLDKLKYGTVLKAVLLILFLWFYAALTGLSPSVLRAATMFSFIIIAKAFKKHTNIYNTLAASAFFLLLIDPYLILEVGFQLSYLAVIGIVCLQPMISSLLEPENGFLKQAWSVTAVSIAAQLATFPLGLYYFHQFPNYFLLSNLVVIPLSTLIIYLGIALFSLSSVPLGVKYIAAAFAGLIWLLNASVKWIGGFPYALIEGITITATETLLIYALTVFLLLYLAQRRYSSLVITLSLVIALLLSQALEQFRQQRQMELAVYNVKGNTAISLLKGSRVRLLADSALLADEGKLRFHILPHCWEKGISNKILLPLDTAGQALFSFMGKRVAIVRSAISSASVQKPFHIDYLVLTANAKMELNELVRLYDPGLIIFDASNKAGTIRKWSKECRKRGKKYYSVTENGAFVQAL